MSTTIRPRRRDDLPELGELLMAQQPHSRYPFRNPLPVSTDRFLHADDADAAWVVERNGLLVGHVCRIGPPQGFPNADEMNAACARVHGCVVDDLAWVANLFVGAHARGEGIGRLLLDTVVHDIRRSSASPCLEVLPAHPAAVGLYRASGWRDVMTLRPDWLRAAAGDRGPDVHVMVHIE